MENKLILVGLGPHSKRIYIRFIINNKCKLAYIVDVREKEEEIKAFLKEKGLLDVKLYLIDSLDKDDETLKVKYQNDLKEIIKKEKITHAIISTEPKAHYAYLKFFINEEVNVLVDKPVIVVNDLTTNQKRRDELIIKMREICDLYRSKKDKINVSVMCQRRYSDVYLFLKNYIKEIISEYNIGITNMHITTSDGMWNMPDEFYTRNNHPYKYGYGKLMHSGYHFIDLVLYLLNENINLKEKEITKLSLKSSAYFPKDFFKVMDNNEYNKLFKTEVNYEQYFNSNCFGFGEIDVHSILDFKDKENHLLTTVTLDMLQSAFSRRAWLELPVDTYKGNGRIKHNFIEINLGPLVSIKIISVQAKLKKEGFDGIELGDNDHFEIQIYRNTELIGGELITIYNAADFTNKNNDFIGYNEVYRENLFLDFLNNQKGKSDLLTHYKSMLLTKYIYDSIQENKEVEFKLKGSAE